MKSDKEILQRFWTHVRRGNPGECWEWLGAKTPHGYGRVTIRGERLYAHRFIYRVAYGINLLPDVFVRHICNNPSCVNPYHLRHGSALDNAQDRERSGHTARGHVTGVSKLTDEQVMEIRRRWATGTETHRTLARAFGIQRQTISSIVNGRSWHHLEVTNLPEVMPEVYTCDLCGKEFANRQARGSHRGWCKNGGRFPSTTIHKARMGVLVVSNDIGESPTLLETRL